MAASIPHVTPRERDIIRLAVAGRTNREIACELKIGEQSVKNALSNVYLKCGVRNRVELVSYALRHHLA